MMVVAITGLMVGFEIGRRRRATFLELARLHANTAWVLRNETGESDEPGPHGDPATNRRRADYCAALSRKYERAARYP